LHVVGYDSDNLFRTETQECFWVWPVGYSKTEPILGHGDVLVHGCLVQPSGFRTEECFQGKRMELLSFFQVYVMYDTVNKLTVYQVMINVGEDHCRREFFVRLFSF